MMYSLFYEAQNLGFGIFELPHSFILSNFLISLFKIQGKLLLDTFQGLKHAPKKSWKVKSKENEESLELSFVGTDQLILMVEIHKKILAFRDLMDLASCNRTASLREVLCNFFLFGEINATIPSRYILACFTNLSFICHRWS